MQESTARAVKAAKAICLCTCLDTLDGRQHFYLHNSSKGSVSRLAHS